MSFAALRDHQEPVLQLAEMEEEGSLERFARGWYWCKDCGNEKPEDYQYIEIAKVNPRAVICMDSAAWLAGMLKEEPATIAVATARTDRKKMDLENFEIRRFYFQNADVPGEICEKKTEFGSYKYYSPKRTFCDCLRMNNKMPEEVKEEILTWCRKQKYSKEEKEDFAEQKNKMYVELLEDMTLADLPKEVKTTLDDLRKQGVLLAIGSSSKNAKRILKHLGLENYFDAISDGTNITKSKPDPEVVLKAADYLQLEPQECLVVEGAVAGIKAATAGGFDSAGLGEASECEMTTYPLSGFAELRNIN